MWWRNKLREAQLAIQANRLQDARRVLQDSNLQQFWPAKQLANELADKMVQRAEKQATSGEPNAAWNNLHHAKKLAADSQLGKSVQEKIITQELAAIHHLLSTGEIHFALARLENLAGHTPYSEAVRTTRMLAQRLNVAHDQAAAGDFPKALLASEKAIRLAKLQDIPHLTKSLRTLNQSFLDHSKNQQLLSQTLMLSLESENWTKVLTTANQMLQIAPQDQIARRARHKAWKTVGLLQTLPHKSPTPVVSKKNTKPAPNQDSVPLEFKAVNTPVDSIAPPSFTINEIPVTSDSFTQQAILWIDAVGGFRLCWDETLVMGQPTPDGSTNFPIMGDVSRRHAVLRREAGNYLLEPVQETYLDGQLLSGITLLQNNQLIQLGSSVQIRFCKPHALSATAKLTFESSHRTEPSVDATLLMAESCILGPQKHHHIQCPEWEHEILLYRQQQELYCRSAYPLTIDGVTTSAPTLITTSSQIETENFAIGFEPI